MLPPVRRKPLGPPTQIADIFGGGDVDPGRNRARQGDQFALVPHDGIKMSALAEDQHAAEGALSPSPPLPHPWIKPPDAWRRPLGMAAVVDMHPPPSGGVPDLEQEVAAAKLAARVAACERQAQAWATQARSAETRIMQLEQQLEEGMRSQTMTMDDRINSLQAEIRSLTASAGRTVQQVDTTARAINMAWEEQFRGLQGELHSVSATAAHLAQQQSQTEADIHRILTRQTASMEDGKAVAHTRTLQLQTDVDRLARNLEDAISQISALKGEMGTRVTSLEAVGRNLPASTAAIVAGPNVEQQSQAMMDMRQQLQVARQSEVQLGAKISELQSSLTSEVAARNALAQQHGARISELMNGMTAERNDLTRMVSQRLEVLESRLGMERNDLAAKHAELRGELVNGDNNGSSLINSMAAQLRSELEGVARSARSEVAGVKESLEGVAKQLQTWRVSEEEQRRSSENAMVAKGQTAADKQLEALRSLRQEMESSVGELRRGVKEETSIRLAAEQRLGSNMQEAVQGLTRDITEVRNTMDRQMAAFSADLDRVRQSGAERADQLSRYCDAAVAEMSKNKGSHVEEEALSDLLERVRGLQKAIEEHGVATERRLATMGDDLRARLRQREEAAERQAASQRNDVEQMAAATENRRAAMQDELQHRVDTYVKHFDAAIAALHANIFEASSRELEARRARPIQQGAPLEVSQLGHIGLVPAAGASRSFEVPLEVLASKPLTDGLLSYSGSGSRQHASWPWRKEVAKPALGDDRLPQLGQFTVLIDDLPLRQWPDASDEVKERLRRRTIVFVKSMGVGADGCQWARVAGEGAAHPGGFVRTHTDSGAPLLQAVDTSHSVTKPKLEAQPSAQVNRVGIAPAGSAPIPGAPLAMQQEAKQEQSDIFKQWVGDRTIEEEPLAERTESEAMDSMPADMDAGGSAEQGIDKARRAEIVKDALAKDLALAAATTELDTSTYRESVAEATSVQMVTASEDGATGGSSDATFAVEPRVEVQITATATDRVANTDAAEQPAPASSEPELRQEQQLEGGGEAQNEPRTPDITERSRQGSRQQDHADSQGGTMTRHRPVSPVD
mmetsp:Transcript_42297/g.76687  ORF Transcript_42297/g.76687 Transcript_42297/m.76687 type:complete len:1082 (+) Transcript_42297:44-3289(+)